MKKPIILGVTIGDVGGIGPEVALKAALSNRWPRRLRLVFVGSRSVLRSECRRLRMPVPPAWNPGSGTPGEQLNVWDPAVSPRLKQAPGRVTISASRAAAAWIEACVEECVTGSLSGMVTAPITKEGFKKAGIEYPGHTEMLADLTGTRDFAMMLMGGPLRVIVATRHMPLRDVPRALDREGVILAGRFASEALAWLGCDQKAIGVCGLNPHAGDGGALGGEEKEIIVPAIRALRRRGIDVDGPVPGDTAFHAAVNGRYGAVVAMYHDQGLAPLKALAFDSGVNLTLGLPIVRTSPDHGTAFDIAGKGLASPRSMINAIKLAYGLADKGSPWR